MTTRTANNRLLILDRLSKGDATTRSITGPGGSVPLEIPRVELGVTYTAVLSLLHRMERDGLITSSRGTSLTWKLTSLGERELADLRREAAARHR